MTLVHRRAKEYVESRRDQRNFQGERREIAFESYLHGANDIVKRLAHGIREMSTDPMLTIDERQLLLVVVDIIESVVRVES